MFEDLLVVYFIGLVIVMSVLGVFTEHDNKNFGRKAVALSVLWPLTLVVYTVLGLVSICKENFYFTDDK